MTEPFDNVIVPLVGDLEVHHREEVLKFLEEVFGEQSGKCRRATYGWQFRDDGMGTNSRLLVYWHRGRAAGTAGLFDTTLHVDGVPHTAAFFTDLAVSPDCRGQGVGARLTEAVQVAGHEITIGLGTNTASNRIMKKQGFVEVGGLRPMFRLLRLEGFVRRRLERANGAGRRAIFEVLRRADVARWQWLRPRRGRFDTDGGQESARAASTSEPGNRSMRDLLVRGRFRAAVHVQPVERFPPELDRLMQAVPHFWPITIAPDHRALNRRYEAHPGHRYRLEVAFRGREPAGVAAWRVFPEPHSLTMGHLSMLYFLPGDREVADALIVSGLSWLHGQGAYMVKALGSEPRFVQCLRRHWFFPRGESPGLLFFAPDPQLRRRLEAPWLVHLGTSDLDIR